MNDETNKDGEKKTVSEHISEWFAGTDEFFSATKTVVVDCLSAAFAALKDAFGIFGTVAIVWWLTAPTFFGIGLVSPTVMAALPSILAGVWLVTAMIKYLQQRKERSAMEQILGAFGES